jgi:exopolysaccharide production protein ExoZ
MAYSWDQNQGSVMGAPTAVLVPIQILRGIAATAVIFSHFQSSLFKIFGPDVSTLTMHTGSAGVDLFFVISGFVMVYASERLFGQAGASRTFLLHRVVRIIPLYWLATTVYLVLALVVPRFGKSYTSGLIVASYLFVPFAHEGYVQPVVGQGWTLNYEMFFYVLFAVALFGTRRTAVAICALALCGYVAIGHLIGPLPLALRYWSSPIVLEFVLGTGLALLYREGVKLPKSVGVALMAIGFAAIFVLSALVAGDDSYRMLTWGVPSALVIAGATLSEFSPTSALWRPAVLVGDASYALYLFHFFPVRGVLYFARWLRLDVVRFYWLLLALAVLCAIGVAIIVHYLFEKPATKFLRSYAASREGISGSSSPSTP